MVQIGDTLPEACGAWQAQLVPSDGATGTLAAAMLKSNLENVAGMVITGDMPSNPTASFNRACAGVPVREAQMAPQAVAPTPQPATVPGATV